MPAERPAFANERPLRGFRTLAAFALVIAVLALLWPSRSLADGGCGQALSAEAVLRRLNDIRTAGRVCHATQEALRPIGEPLTWSDSLAAAALSQAREMAAQNRMSHLDREQRSLGPRLRALGYRFAAAYENVAVGFGSVDDVVEAWLQSEHHCENLMRASVAELGLACIDGSSAEPRSERRFWTLVLAAPKPR